MSSVPRTEKPSERHLRILMRRPHGTEETRHAPTLQDNGWPVQTFALITTEANALVGRVQHRMPVIVRRRPNGSGLLPISNESTCSRSYPRTRHTGCGCTRCRHG
jgi:hypothetical protein